MAKKVRIRLNKYKALVIYRTAFQDDKLVYIAVANKKLRYKHGSSRIAYIGTTKKGARRIASSAARKGESLLEEYGIQKLEFYIVTCKKVPGVATWRKLERAFLIRFNERFHEVPRGNKVGKNFHYQPERHYFSQSKLDAIIDQLEAIK